MEILDNGIDVFGVSENIVLKSEYFKEFDAEFCDAIENEVIENLLSVSIMQRAGDIDIIKTPIMMSNEGIYLSGYKLKVELIIHIKLKYISKISPNKIGLYNKKRIKIVYIVVPLHYGRENVVDLLRRKRIIVNPYIEDIYCEIKDRNNIYTNLSSIVTADFIKD